MTLRIEQQGAVARFVLDRPQVRHAFDAALVAALSEALAAAAEDPAIRAVVLAAEGPVFSAGADLAWMRRMGAASEEENLADALALARLMRLLDTCPKPTLARVQGSAFGGALGLIACCDVAVGVEAACFATSEVRLGLIPSVIGPYVVRAVGPRAARRLFLAAARIDAAEALRLGLLHEVVAPEDLDAAVERHLAALTAGAPGAQAEAKRLVADLAPLDAATVEDTARRIAALRGGAEAREGLAAFLEKRRPAWAPEAAP